MIKKKQGQPMSFLVLVLDVAEFIPQADIIDGIALPFVMVTIMLIIITMAMINNNNNNIFIII